MDCKFWPESLLDDGNDDGLLNWLFDDREVNFDINVNLDVDNIQLDKNFWNGNLPLEEPRSLESLDTFNFSELDEPYGRPTIKEYEAVHSLLLEDIAKYTGSEDGTSDEEAKELGIITEAGMRCDNSNIFTSSTAGQTLLSSNPQQTFAPPAPIAPPPPPAPPASRRKNVVNSHTKIVSTSSTINGKTEVLVLDGSSSESVLNSKGRSLLRLPKGQTKTAPKNSFGPEVKPLSLNLQGPDSPLRPETPQSLSNSDVEDCSHKIKSGPNNDEVIDEFFTSLTKVPWPASQSPETKVTSATSPHLDHNYISKQFIPDEFDQPFGALGVVTPSDSDEDMDSSSHCTEPSTSGTTPTYKRQAAKAVRTKAESGIQTIPAQKPKGIENSLIWASEAVSRKLLVESSCDDSSESSSSSSGSSSSGSSSSSSSDEDDDMGEEYYPYSHHSYCNVAEPGPSSQVMTRPQRMPMPQEQPKPAKRAYTRRTERNTKSAKPQGRRKKTSRFGDENSSEKREAHNDKERARRLALRGALLNLKKQVPELESSKKAKKQVILDTAAKYCLKLAKMDIYYMKEVEMLRQKQAELRKKLSPLRIAHSKLFQMNN